MMPYDKYVVIFMVLLEQGWKKVLSCTALH